MIEINSKDYHDYVIQKGSLIGEFEQMYTKSEGIPWNQDKEAYAIYSNFIIEMMKSMNITYNNILDIGCGLGFFSQRLKKFGKVTGIDISITAVQKAKESFPDVNFFAVDIKNKNLNFVKEYYKKFELIILKEIIWYILPEINQVIDNISSLLHDRSYLIVSQFFPPLDIAFYGKDKIPSPEALLNLFKINYYQPIYLNVLNRFEVSDEGPLVTCMYKKC